MYDEINIDAPKPVRFSQLKFVEADSLSPATKRARLDINYSIAPAVFTNGTTTQLVQKQQFQQVTQQQLLQQQQNRRKMTLVNRIA